MEDINNIFVTLIFILTTLEDEHHWGYKFTKIVLFLPFDYFFLIKFQTIFLSERY